MFKQLISAVVLVLILAACGGVNSQTRAGAGAEEEARPGLSGQVFNKQGNPLRYVVVTVSLKTDKEDEQASCTKTTDREGRFKCESLDLSAGGSVSFQKGSMYSVLMQKPEGGFKPFQTEINYTGTLKSMKVTLVDPFTDVVNQLSLEYWEDENNPFSEGVRPANTKQ